MKYGLKTRHRRSIRLKDYDYTGDGAYFVTVCIKDRDCLFGEVVDDAMRLNAAGEMVLAEWGALSDRFPTVELDAFIVMPNHIHGVIVITCDGNVGAGLVPAPHVSGADTNRATTRVAPTLGNVVGAFKSLTTVLYARGVKQSGWPAFAGRLWQRNYYEHVIRGEVSLNRIRQYILDNPAQWAFDRENPLATEPEPEGTWQA
ncbi:MAG TPA: transposase [Rhizobiales bacterium]|nr:transposase [Hyphomicrobiales bacterium]